MVILLLGLYGYYFAGPSEEFSTIDIKLEQVMPTLHLIGDSSMCRGGTNNGKKGLKYQGWGEYMQDYFLCNVTSHAISGRSSRMYTREGRFDKVLDIVKPGDYVIIQFGRNEKGKLKPRDNGKTVCPGSDRETTCASVFEGKNVTVLTFGGYMENATDAFKAKGATVIIGAQTPNKPFVNSGKFYETPTQWVEYAQLSANRTNVTYVNHFAYAIDAFRRLGREESDKLYPDPQDKSHTNDLGADFMARAFLRGLMCTDNQLSQYFNMTAIERVTGDCLSGKQ
ncbi:hypothetical protein ABW19_dt0210477 [Dactylella cylindrospora]|nr:hypothetical protein ABW19_dt0210477 [Dactylella cylindrospora]